MIAGDVRIEAAILLYWLSQGKNVWQAHGKLINPAFPRHERFPRDEGVAGTLGSHSVSFPHVTSVWQGCGVRAKSDSPGALPGRAGHSRTIQFLRFRDPSTPPRRPRQSEQ
eukprot:4434749-Pyramimonas_sp.AAC.1